MRVMCTFGFHDTPIAKAGQTLSVDASSRRHRELLQAFSHASRQMQRFRRGGLEARITERNVDDTRLTAAPCPALSSLATDFSSSCPNAAKIAEEHAS